MVSIFIYWIKCRSVVYKENCMDIEHVHIFFVTIFWIIMLLALKDNWSEEKEMGLEGNQIYL